MSSLQLKELHSGILSKCGGKVKTWNKRWMILKSDHCLYYYKDTAKGHLGVISLRDTRFKVRKGEKGDCSWPKSSKLDNTIVIVTSTRTYFMFADTVTEAEQWRIVMNDVHEALLENAHKGNRLLSRSYPGSSSSTRTSSSSESEKDLVVQRSSPQEIRKDGQSTAATTTTTTGPLSDTNDCQNYEAIYSQPSDELEDISGGEVRNGGTPQTQTAAGTSLVDESIDAIYDLAQQPDETPSTTNNIVTNGVGGVDIPQPNYEPMDIIGSLPQNDGVVCGSIKNQPLPPIPKDSSISVGKPGTNLAIYEDVLDNVQPLYEDVDKTQPISQPLYEDVDTKGNVGQGRESAQEAQDSGDEGDSTLPLPALPPRDSLPPLPTKDSKDFPPLPPKDNPPLPPKDTKDNPPLPPKDSKDNPPLPPKDSKDNPPLPPKDSKDDPPLPSKETLNETDPAKVTEGNLTQPPSLPAKDRTSPLPQPLTIPAKDNSNNSPPPSPIPSSRKSPVPGKRKSPPSPRREVLSPSGKDNFKKSSPPSPRRRQSPVGKEIGSSLPQPAPKDIATSPVSSSSPQIRPKSPRYEPQPVVNGNDAIYDAVTEDNIDEIGTAPIYPIPGTQVAVDAIYDAVTEEIIDEVETTQIHPVPAKRPQDTTPQHPQVGWQPQPQTTKAVGGGAQQEGKRSPKSGGKPSPKGERGLEMFRKRQQYFNEVSEADTKQRAVTIKIREEMTSDPLLSPDDKVLISETLREVEHERLKASEERYRWERERMNLEEERRKFELEKRKLQEELEKTRQQLLNN